MYDNFYLKYYNCNMTTYYIYALIDPRNDQIAYIGMTSRSLQERWRGHLKQSELKTQTKKSRWLNKLNELGLLEEVQIIEIERTTDDKWAERERYWISYYRNLNPELKNTTDGGEGIPGYRHTDETKQKIKEKRALQVFGDEFRAYKAEAMTGNNYAAGKKFPPRSEEHTRKLVESRRASGGYELSEETREKMRQSHLGKPTGRKGIPMPEGHQAKMQKAREGKPGPMTGKTMTDEMKAKMKESQQTRRAAEREKGIKYPSHAKGKTWSIDPVTKKRIYKERE